MKDCNSKKKHDANYKENSLEWATPMTRPKKSITKTKNNSIQSKKKYSKKTCFSKKCDNVVNETAPAIKKHGTTDSNNETTENTKTKNVST